MVQNKITEKIRTITPEQFHAETMEIIRMSLRSLLFKYQISYKIEKDPAMKKQRLEAWQETLSVLSQCFAVLDIAEKERIKSVTVETISGKIFDCTKAKPVEFGDNELANLLIEFSKSVTK